MNRRQMSALCMTLFFSSWWNAFGFVIISCLLGGFAYEGRIADGHYFLGATRGRRAHEKEVSRGVFVYSKIHGWIVLVTLPICIVSAVVARSVDKRDSA